MYISNKHGVSFNQWNELYHGNGREKGGTEWLKNQLMILNLAIENAEQLDQHYNDKTPYLNNWNYNGATTETKWNFK